MKKITLLGSIIVLLFISCTLGAQNRRPFHVIPLVPVVGQEVKFTYDNSLTSLAGEETIHGTVYYWQDLHWEAEDLPLVKNDTAWEASVTVPDRCALVVCKFYAGDKRDSGGRATYATMTFDRDGRNLPTSYMAWGMLRNKTLESLPGYCEEEAYIDDEVMRFWLNQQLMKDPGARQYVFYYAAKLLDKMVPGEKHEQMLADVDFVLSLPDADEETLLKARDVARNIVKDTAKTSEVERHILNKYPDGILARDQEIWRVFRVSDPDAKGVELEAFLKRFPVEKFRDVETETSGMYLGKIFQSAVYQPIISKNDYSLLYKYIHDVPHGLLLTFYWHMVQVPLSTNQRRPEQVLPFATLIYNEIMTRPRAGSDRVYSDREWKQQLLARGKDMILAHASVLAATGAPEEALNLMEEIKDIYAYKSAVYNDLYTRLLETNGYESLVIPTIIAGVREDAVTPEMLDRLRWDYLKTHGNDKGFDAYINSLKSAEKQQEMQAHLKESMIKEKITLYAMEDLDGKKVDLSKMKGKIIVLDFWATWCAPCKASLPGMQMAVNKYRNDPDVAFYFIATMETKPDFRQKIREFLVEKNYSLDVLVDNVNPETGSQSAVYDAYCKAFKFSGIPHKMIIDGNGNLRWSVGGYMGSPSALAEEVSYVIEMLKAETNISRK
ncbi:MULTISPECIES: TlpA family protein disulfide reductase [Butyricimonas]|uniref:TlpA family protein disulfide reductase n=1 Tax=Butyricimonas TaxID=574697 RepID=UPI0007FB3EC9|nr:MULTISPECIES: TlpA disulfide reductase family protein [Butyricimonas]